MIKISSDKDTLSLEYLNTSSIVINSLGTK